MTSGEITKYHEAAKAFEGQRIAAGSFEGVNAKNGVAQAEPVRDASTLGFVINDRQAEAQMGKASGAIEGIGKSGAALAIDKQKRAQQDAQKKQNETSTFLAQLLALEEDIAAKYGENFADDLLEDMYLNGMIEQEEYDRIKALQDIGDRRHAVALAYRDAKEAGKVPEGFEDSHAYLKGEWVDLHSKQINERDNQVKEALQNTKRAAEIGTSAKDQAKDKALEKAPDIKSEFEVATVEARENTNTLDQSGIDSLANFDLGGLNNLS